MAGSSMKARMASDRRDPMSLDASAMPLVQWTRLQNDKDPHAPSPRTGHAMALLPPSQSVLLFGGSNGTDFLDDFYVLEPAQYATLTPPNTRLAKQKAKMKMHRASPSQQSQASQASQESTVEGTDKHATPLLVWKKLVISKAKPLPSSVADDAIFPASSFSSEVGSEIPRDVVVKPTAKGKGKGKATVARDSHLGACRDNHTMHYIPTQDERRLGYRVLVVGNVTVRSEDNVNEFDSIDMRVDEVRVKQPQLVAQWVERTIQSMWKPKARNGHCSALLGEQLFCFGGQDVTTSVFYNDLFYFDVGLNQWRKQPSTGRVPTPRAFATMTANASREQLFVFGGHDNIEVFGGFYLFDVRHNRWDKLLTVGDKPITRSNHSLTQVTSNHLLVFGGRKRLSRRNDAFLYDITTMEWKQLAEQTSTTKREPPSSESQSAGSENQSLRQVVTAMATAPVVVPPVRVGHSAVLFGAPSDPQDVDGKTRIIVFGGYMGSNTWLNDLYMMEVDPVALGRPIEGHQPNEDTRSTASREQTAVRGTSSQSSNSTARSSSQGSIEGALVDITNVPHSLAQANRGVARAELPMVSTGTYTPAAVAAQRRRWAEIESGKAEPSSSTTASPPIKHKKQRSHSSASGSSQSQDHSQSPSPEIPISVSAPDITGLHTTMIQLLQSQQRMDASLSSLASLVRQGQSSNTAHRDAFTAHQVFMQKQLDTLETKLDTMTKRYEAMASKVGVLERDKQDLRKQLAATETEVYVYKKNMEEMIPKLRDELFDAVEKAGRAQNTTVQLIESKISVIHDLLEDMRHYSGDRTENDDSPPKKNSMFSDDSSLSPPSQPQSTQTDTPAALYPQTIVRDLKQQLQGAVQDNEMLHKRVEQLQGQLDMTEGNAQRTSEISTAPLRPQQSLEHEEERKSD